MKNTYFNSLCLHKSLTVRYYPTAAKSSKHIKRIIEANIRNNVSIDSFKNGYPLFIHLLYEQWKPDTSRRLCNTKHSQ